MYVLTYRLIFAMVSSVYTYIQIYMKANKILIKNKYVLCRYFEITLKSGKNKNSIRQIILSYNFVFIKCTYIWKYILIYKISPKLGGESTLTGLSYFITKNFVYLRILIQPFYPFQSSLIQNVLPWLCLSPITTTYRVNLLTTSMEYFKQEIEEVLKKRYAVPPKTYTISAIPEMLCLGPTDIAPMPNEQQTEIIVDTCCGAAVLRGAHIYAIGVLAMESGTKIGDLVNVYADLSLKCKKGLNVRYESNEKIYLGQGKVLMQRYQIYRSEGPMQGIAVEMLTTISGVPSIGDLSDQKALLQNFPSIVCSRVLDPKQDEVILDMCSAPGNKTTHLAELIKDRGTIIALDKTENKIKLVKEKIKRNQLQSIRVYAFDSTQCFSESLKQNSIDLKPPFKFQTFDRILLDAPCSALGNRPLLSSNMIPKILQSYVKVQKQLFANAVPLLKSGGTLVYSTCTVNIGENEEIVAWALKKFSELSLQPANPFFGESAWPCEGLNQQECNLLQRFGPANNGKIDTVGFFIAKFVKK